LVHGSAQDESAADTSVQSDNTATQQSEDASNNKLYETERVDENGNTINDASTSNQNNLVALTQKESKSDFWGFIDDGKSFAMGLLDVFMW